MEMSGQRHAPPALPPMIEPPVPTGWTLQPVWRRQWDEKLPASAMNRTPVTQPVAQSLNWLNYLGSLPPPPPPTSIS
jgi:hypothetical protein